MTAVQSRGTGGAASSHGRHCLTDFTTLARRGRRDGVGTNSMRYTSWLRRADWVMAVETMETCSLNGQMVVGHRGAASHVNRPFRCRGGGSSFFRRSRRLRLQIPSCSGNWTRRAQYPWLKAGTCGVWDAGTELSSGSSLGL